MENILQYTNFILAIGVILTWGTLAIMFLLMWICSKIEKNRFFKAAENSLKLHGVVESEKSINNDFEVYRNHRFGFKSQTVIELCQELGQRLKIQGNMEDVQKIESIIYSFKDEYRFDDETMNTVIKNVKKKSSSEDARKTKEYLIRLKAFYEGVIFEKDRFVRDIIEKAERKKWFNRFCGILGVVGSIASIYSIFK